MATSRAYRDAQGELREHTEWHDVVVWGKQAEVVAKHVGKGAMVQVGPDPDPLLGDRTSRAAGRAQLRSRAAS